MSRGSFFRPHLIFSPRRAGRADAASDRAERFRSTMLPHMDAAYNLARYLARDASAAEDIVQEAYLRALRGFDGWRGDSARAWLLRIVRNCHLDSIAATRGTDPIDMLADQADADAPDPEAEAGRSSEAAMLRATIEQLPEPFRETLVLRELEELSYKEIGLATGAPIGTVMSRLARARQMLGELLLPRDDEARRAQP